jgi:hypothetical protein
MTTLTSQYLRMGLQHNQYRSTFGSSHPFRHTLSIGAATSSHMSLNPSTVNPFAPVPLPKLDPPTRSPTTVSHQYAKPRQHIPEVPDAQPLATSSSMLGKTFKEDYQQTRAEMSSMAFDTKVLRGLHDSYKAAGRGDPALYQRKLRDTNLCLKCFSTEWDVPGGRNDPAMNLLFTR